MDFLIEHRSTLVVAAAIGTGLMAGVFFVFSAFVMTALKRLPPHEGLAAMQSINIAVVNPLFLGVFLGTALLCAILVVTAVLHWTQGSVNLLIGSGTYLIGSILVTLACNVPLNNALAKLNPTDPAAFTYWSMYATRWTQWNHVRMVASIIASAALILANSSK